MATETPNLGLRKPTNADTVNVSADISANMDLIDAAVAQEVADREAADSYLRQTFNVVEYGAIGDGSTDDVAAIQAAIDAAPQGSVIYFPASSLAYKVGATLSVTKRGLTFRGTAKFRGSQIRFTGTGELFELGTDSGNPYDTAEYDGAAANTTFEFLNIAYTGSSTTALTNGQGNYGTGTYAIRDWRGGEINLRSVFIEKFEYGFWGIQSDVNTWIDVQITTCKTGVYLGPRSDQFTAISLYTASNDRALDLDRVTNARFKACQFVDDGATTINPIRIRSAWSSGADSIIFDDCWFEHLNVTGTYEAWVEIGIGDSVTSTNVVFNNPWIGTATAPSWHTTYFVKIGRANAVTVLNPHGKYITNVDDLISFVGSTSPQVEVKMHATVAAALGTVNNGTGTPEVYQETWATTGRMSFSAPNGILFNAVVATLITGNDVVVGGNADTTPELSVNGAAGNNRQILLQSGGVNRWILRATNTAEGGSNAGSDLQILSRDDTGAALQTVLTVTRSTGLATFGGAVTVTGAFTGAAITGSSLTASQGAATAAAQVTASAGQARELRFQTAGVNRWLFRATNDAESGSNAGTKLQILGRADDGSALATIFEAKRTGEWAFNGVNPTTIRPTISGSRGGNAALASLLTELANKGIITDGTTA